MMLWLVRHPRPLVETGVCYGATDLDVDRDHTREVAQALAQTLPASTQLVSSPLRRCRLLADAVMRLRSDLVLRFDERLREIHFGRWEGRRWNDIQEAEYAQWLQDFPHHAPGGGESVAQLLMRVQDVLDEPGTPGAVAWITHAGVIRSAQVLRAGSSKLRTAADWPVDGPGFGEWLTLAC